VPFAGKSKLVLDWIVATLLPAITGTEEVMRGIPEAPGARVSVSASLADRELAYKTTSQPELRANFWIEFAYDVETAEAAAEDTLANWVDALGDAWLADRDATGGTMGGLVRTWELDFSYQNDPRYRSTAGSELRVAPVVIRTVINRH
jgi:hypothetical protein